MIKLKGLFQRDPSDARGINAEGGPGSGGAYAPTPSDGRNASGDEVPDTPAVNLSSRYGISPALSPAVHDDDTYSNDRSDYRGRGGENSPHGSGAQQGSPELEYDAPRLVGQRAVEIGPYDGGLTDPIRDGDTPARASVTRFFFVRERWHPDIEGSFLRPDREFIGDANRQAAQPQGRMSPMDEYRLLGDGTHA